MKQLLSLFLILLPCLAWAQYPSNGNQKITLGEQTTADGLIWRGVASDTTLTTKSDTAAYFVLDTVNINLYTYKASATGRKWRQVETDSASIAYVNNYGTQTVNGAKTISGITIFSKTDQAGNAASAPVTFLGGIGVAKDLRVGGNIIADGPNNTLATLNGGDMQFYNTGNLQFGKILSTAGSGGNIRFQANGSTNVLDLSSTGVATIYNLAGGTSNRAVLADVNGSLSAPVSSINYKENVQNLNYGLNEILQVIPVIFNFIDKNKWGDGLDLGFIVEDMFPIIPEVTGTINDGTMYLDMTKLIPILTKAIQEQNSLIKALEQRIINLENK
jgi:hypothetical protein